MYITSTYVSTSRGHHQYLFFLLLQDYIQEEREFSTQMTASLERFARDLGDGAALVRPFRGDIEATRQEVLNKPWPPEAEPEILSTPSLLMIDRDFNAFDPRVHPWLQIRIPLQGHEDETKTTLERLARLVTSDLDDDVFRRAHDLVHGQEQADLRKIISLRPGVFGLSLDLWALGDAVMRVFDSERSGANY